MSGKHAHNWIDRTGEVGYTKHGTPMKIIEYNGASNILIEFLDDYGIKKHTSYEKFTKGTVKNPYDRTVFGEGLLGEGGLAVENNEKTKEYRVWSLIIYRCCYKKYSRKLAPYKDCEVSEEWKNYSNFYKWYEDNFYECSDQLEVDKDILSKEEKIYSKETCLLIPREINGFCKPSKQGGCYLTVCNKWSANVNRRSGYTHIGNFDNFEEAEIEFIKCKNSIFQSLVDKYKGELPKYVYKKLKNAKLRR